jgi:hypothetical protein
MGLVLAKAETEDNKEKYQEGDLAKARKESETFFFTDVPPPRSKPPRSSSTVLRANSKYGTEGYAKHWGDSKQTRTDTSCWTTESTKGPPEVGKTRTTFEWQRRNSHQDPPKLVSIGWFRHSYDDSTLPPSLLVINKSTVKNGSCWESSRRREKTRSCPLPVVRCAHCGYEEENTAQLQRHYDERTWDMFERITQSREKQQQQLSNNGVHVPQEAEQSALGSYDGSICGQCLSDVPAVPTASPVDASHCPYYPECEDCEHEMMFGDLD